MNAVTWRRLPAGVTVAVTVAAALLLTTLPAAGGEVAGGEPAPRLAFTGGCCSTPAEISVLEPDWSHRAIVNGRSGLVEEHTPTAPVWSPDGRRITYVVVDVTGSRIRTVRADGSRDTLVATLPGHYAWEFDRAPSDGWMAIIAAGPCPTWGCPAQGELFLVSPDGGLIVKLGPAQDVTWAPRGSRLAYTVGGRVLVVDVGPAAPSRPRDVTPDGVVFVGRVAWAPAGDRLAFAGRQTDVLASTAPPIWTVDADGRNGRRLPARTWWGLSWSPDGRWIAYANAGLRAVATDGTVTRTIVGDRRIVDDPVWSPDGRWIAFKRDEQACCSYPLAVVHPDGTGLRRVAWTIGGAEVSFAASQ